MITHADSDRLEDAIDRFESNWTLEATKRIRTLLSEYELEEDLAGITEMVRVDIELRYRLGVPLPLEDYLDEFESLQGSSRHVAQIVYEDYRCRAASGLPMSLSRWNGIPGVRDQFWFQQLNESKPNDSKIRDPINGKSESRVILAKTRWGQSSHHPLIDPDFESDLESIGFRLINQIGSGAFSSVYLATQNDLADRFVVLKIVDQPLSEPQSMAMLQHTNIMPIYSFHRVRSRSILCMPYAGSVTLADYLESPGETASLGGDSLVETIINGARNTIRIDGQSEPPQELSPASLTPAANDQAVMKPLEQLRLLERDQLALWIFARIAAALAHSHARGILHGDLKPDNVLIRNDGEPALLDFNLSHDLNQATAKHIGGTLPYMSPESLRALMGQSVTPHAASDMYSVGVMLFQFITGRLPYPAPASIAPVDLEPAIAARRRAADWQADDLATPSVRAIIDRCLVFEEHDRYASTEALREDLECESNDLPLKFAAEPRLERGRKWIRRHPRSISAGSVGAAMMALLIPLAIASALAMQNASRLKDHSRLEAFTEASAETLSSLMVDPQRDSKSKLVAALKPLEDIGHLHPNAKNRLDPNDLTGDDREQLRETKLRHLLQIAVHEIRRLKGVSRRSNVELDDLQQLDLLLETASREMQGEAPMRAILFAQSERARLLGDEAQATELQQQAQQVAVEDENDAYLEAVRLVSIRRLTPARELLKQLAGTSAIPSALPWTLQGRAQQDAGDYDGAKLSYTRSLEYAPESAALFLLRGMCHFRLKEFAQCEADMRRVMEINPNSVPAHVNLGLSLKARGMLSEAVDVYTSGLAKDPGNARLLLLRSKSYENMGLEAEAEQDYDEALQTDNLTFASLNDRALARKQNGDLNGALTDINQAQELDPLDSRVWINTAAVLVKLGRIEETIDALDEALNVDPEYEKAMIDKAVMLARLQRYDEALDVTAQANKPPNKPRTVYQTACVYALCPQEGSRIIALGNLALALQQGYGVDVMETDSDLDSLRDMEGFNAIVRTSRLAKFANRSTKSVIPKRVAPRPQ